MTSAFIPPNTGSRPLDEPSGFAPVTLSEVNGVRCLHFGSEWVQGAMRLAWPLKIELDCVRRMMVWMLFRPEADFPGLAPWRGLRTIQLGLGAGAITRYCYQVLGAHTTAVELNPEVVRVCHDSFHLPPQSDSLKILQQDAGQFVEDPTRRETANALCVDLYDHEAAEPVLDTEAFYQGCWSVLRPGGIMTMNLFGRHSSFERTTRRVAAAFGSEAIFSMQPTPEGNTVVGALKQVRWPQPSELAVRAANIEAIFDLPASQWLNLMVR